MTSVMIPPAWWELPGGVEVHPLAPADDAAVLAMVERCSRTTLFHRFHNFTDGRTYARSLFHHRPGYRTLLARYGMVCIGIADLADDAQGSADLGVLVEDAWQRRGVGSQLMWVLLETARWAGLTRVHADVLGEDQFILRSLRKLAPIAVSLHSGAFSVDIDLGPECLGPPVQ
jgi:GNAT superfamily N-acetyltransferase